MTLDTAVSRLGARIRAARTERGRSLREAARALGVSPSLLSQIELGAVRPSVATLYRVVQEFGISLDEVFADGDADAEPYVRRAAARERIELGNGVAWERLTPGRDETVDFVRVSYEPGEPGERLRHAGHEYGTLVEGSLHVEVGADAFELHEGDSVAFPSSLPHRMWSEHGATAIWVSVGNR